jgi:hypothetical protein
MNALRSQCIDAMDRILRTGRSFKSGHCRLQEDKSTRRQLGPNQDARNGGCTIGIPPSPLLKSDSSGVPSLTGLSFSLP